MASAFWLVAPYTAFLSFLLGHVWRWRRDRFQGVSPAGRTRAVGLAMLRVGIVCVIGTRIAEMAVTGEHRPAPVGIVVVEAIGIPVAIVGAVVVLLPDVLSATPRQPVTPFDRATVPILLAGLLSGMIVQLDTGPIDTYNHTSETLFVWFPSLFTAHPNAAPMVHASIIYQARGLVVLVVIAIWPYTRLCGIMLRPLLSLRRRRGWSTPPAASDKAGSTKQASSKTAPRS